MRFVPSALPIRVVPTIIAPKVPSHLEASLARLVSASLLLTILSNTWPVWAQDPPPPDRRSQSWSDYGGLLMILHNRGYRILTQGEELRAGTSLAIVLGTPPEDSDQPNLLLFTKRGGAVLIASDRPEAQSLFEEFAIQLDTATVRITDTLAVEAYLGFPDCPILAIPESAAHPILAGVKRLAFNRPGALTSSSFSPTLRYPPGLSSDAGLLIAADQIEASGNGQEGRGRFVALADHSLFINAMLIAADNRACAENIIAWLEDGLDPGLVALEGKSALLICEGKVQAGLRSVKARRDKGLGGIPNAGVLNLALARIERDPRWGRELAKLEQYWGWQLLTALPLATLFGLALLATGFITAQRRPATPDLLAPTPPSDAPSFIELRHAGAAAPTFPVATARAFAQALRQLIAARLELPRDATPALIAERLRALAGPDAAKAFLTIPKAEADWQGVVAPIKRARLSALRHAAAKSITKLTEPPTP